MTTIEELRHTANCLADSADEALLIKAAEELEALQRRCDMLLIQQTHDENARADLKDVITAINFEVADLRTQNRELREALGIGVNVLQRIATHCPINDEPLATQKCNQATEALKQIRKATEGKK